MTRGRYDGIGFPHTSKALAVYPKGVRDPNLFYAYLGVVPQSSFEEIHKAYKCKAKQVHPDISGDVENTVVQLIIRDHDRDLFNKRKAVVQQIVDDLNKQIPNVAVAEIKDQYYNMGEKIKPVMHIVEVAERAMKELGITPITKPIRGGTDGSQLSFMGLPCPNIFAG